MKPILGLALIAAVVVSSSAYAGCIGGAVGDACIGLPTPREHREVYERREHQPVVVERHHWHHDHPVVIERHYHDYDDED
jgi:hypothetical protein